MENWWIFRATVRFSWGGGDMLSNFHFGPPSPPKKIILELETTIFLVGQKKNFVSLLKEFPLSLTCFLQHGFSWNFLSPNKTHPSESDMTSQPTPPARNCWPDHIRSWLCQFLAGFSTLISDWGTFLGDVFCGWPQSDPVKLCYPNGWCNAIHQVHQHFDDGIRYILQRRPGRYQMHPTPQLVGETWPSWPAHECSSRFLHHPVSCF